MNKNCLNCLKLRKYFFFETKFYSTLLQLTYNLNSTYINMFKSHNYGSQNIFTSYPSLVGRGICV